MVTTSVLGDVVRSLFGDAAEIAVLMPTGVDPHDFRASAQQVEAVRSADLVVVNGGGLEEGVLDSIRSAADDGVSVHTAIEAVEQLPGSDDGEPDPHFFTDPARMAVAARAILDAAAAEVPELDTPAVRGRANAYLEELAGLDREIEELLEPIPPTQRVLVTSHAVLGYFAERYGFEVLGVVEPGGSTSGASGAGLTRLAGIVRDAGVPAIFVDASSSDDLARTVADEVGGVDVVELFTESLGPPGSEGDTYVEMLRTNARRIAQALS